MRGRRTAQIVSPYVSLHSLHALPCLLNVTCRDGKLFRSAAASNDTHPSRRDPTAAETCGAHRCPTFEFTRPNETSRVFVVGRSNILNSPRRRRLASLSGNFRAREDAPRRSPLLMCVGVCNVKGPSSCNSFCASLPALRPGAGLTKKVSWMQQGDALCDALCRWLRWAPALEELQNG